VRQVVESNVSTEDERSILAVISSAKCIINKPLSAVLDCWEHCGKDSIQYDRH
jgi:hypothetical protein